MPARAPATIEQLWDERGEVVYATEVLEPEKISSNRMVEPAVVGYRFHRSWNASPIRPTNRLSTN